MISVSLSGLQAPTHEIEACRQQYARASMLVLPSLFSKELCDILIGQLRCAVWTTRLHEDNGDIASEEVARCDAALGLLGFVICEPQFIEMVRAITGDHEITSFRGRIFRMNPSVGHYDSWHDDINGQRRVGMSLCLEEIACNGGGFELRHALTHEILGAVTQRRLGDATLFRIGDDLEHRVMPVKSDSVRVAYAGWFLSGMPDLRATLSCENPAGA